MTIRLMLAEDIPAAARVHQAAFPRQGHSPLWLQCHLNASPLTLCFVAQQHNEIVGYILWTQKSGFRPEAVLELEQLAVDPQHQNKGIGRRLISDSLPLVKQQLSRQGSTLKHILVTTRSDNHAQQLYRETLGAEAELTIRNLYSADEVLMIARNVTESPGGNRG